LLNPLSQHNTRSSHGVVGDDDLTQGDTNSYLWLNLIIDFYEVITVI
jgi:hypothetical protein